MKIYIDLIIFINIFFDFLLLLTVSLILRRNVRIIKIIYGSIVGGISILFLFLNIDLLTLNLLKIVISILMVLSTFGYRNIKYTFKNLSFLYLTSIVLGGALYFLNVQFSYKNTGIIFYHNGFSINFIVILISTPLLLFFYIKELKNMKINYSKYHKVIIYFKSNKYIRLTGYLDTGNNLIDPYKNRPIILIEHNKIKNYILNDKEILVPYKGINNEGILRCIKISKIIVDGKTIKNVLVGILDNNIYIDGVDCILNNKLTDKEELCLEN